MNPIRKYFKPYQPSIEYSNIESVNYEEYAPHPDLQDYIYCYWQLNTIKQLENNFMYRVVSDGCIDILYEQKSSQNIFITGFSNKFIEYDLGDNFNYRGIRFLPTGFPAMFDVSATALTNKFIPLIEVVPKLAAILLSEFSKSMNFEEAIRKYDNIFSQLLSQRTTPIEIDKRFLNATDKILQSRGVMNLYDLDVGISERQLRRLFGFYFGESPKTFSKIIRFQNILAAKPTSQSLKHDKIFFDEGYYDQAHFIKEFKAFYGVTPNRAFGR